MGTPSRVRNSFTQVRIALSQAEQPRSDFRVGQVLSDDKTVESCNIKEKGFLVLMVAKVHFIQFIALRHISLSLYSLRRNRSLLFLLPLLPLLQPRVTHRLLRPPLPPQRQQQLPLPLPLSLQMLQFSHPHRLLLSLSPPSPAPSTMRTRSSPVLSSKQPYRT